VHGVFCQTIMKSCQIHYQFYIRNNIDKILPKFCNIFFIKQFTLTLNSILIVLLKLTIFRKNSKFKSGVQAPPQKKVAGPRFMRPSWFRHLYAYVEYNAQGMLPHHGFSLLISVACDCVEHYL